ncbi:hypothetical protein KRP22_013810 [Phytophthora ramorum]|nr:hypothetical protein KRP22_13638 [Phytophthora ramorum]
MTGPRRPTWTASASSDGSVVLWQMQLDEEALAFGHMLQPTEALHVLQSPEGPADCLAWSPDSRFLLSSGRRSSTIQLWDRMSGCPQRIEAFDDFFNLRLF